MINTGNIWLIAFGANLPSAFGTPQATLTTALVRLTEKGFKPRAVSRFYRSAAYPPGSGPDYINGCVIVEYNHNANFTLETLNKTESELGRVRHDRWGARVVDLDLIGNADEMVLPNAGMQDFWRNLPLEQQKTDTPTQLILPHPRMQDRAFVLIPLAEIAPAWRHPVLGLSVTEMLDRLPESEKSQVMPISAAECEPLALALGQTSA